MEEPEISESENLETFYAEEFELTNDKFSAYLRQEVPKVKVWSGNSYSKEVTTVFKTYSLSEEANINIAQMAKRQMNAWMLDYTEYARNI